MSLYNVADYSTPEEFLLSFAKRFGLLGKKGIPDILKAARVLIQDWNRLVKMEQSSAFNPNPWCKTYLLFSGKIRFYTSPPEDLDSHISAEIVTDHTQEFSLSELEMMETNLLSVISETSGDRHCAYLTIGNENSRPLTEVILGQP